MVSEPMAETAELLQDMVARADTVAAMQRDPTIPAGTVLGEQDVRGAVHREVKHNSMVRMGKVPLPERFEVWDKFGNSSMVPTAQMTYMLSKPRADNKAERAFHTHSRGVTRATCGICPAASKPFDGTCEWCLERTAGQVRKKFRDENARERHYIAFHPDEFGALQRRLEREDRKAEIAAQKELAQAILKAVKPSRSRKTT